jgi:S1-C subfamily serine protease
MHGKAWIMAPLLALPVWAQGYGRPSTTITPEEQAVIETNRKGAATRPIKTRQPLDAREAARVKVFKVAKPSVVYITSATKRIGIVNLATGDVFAIPPGTGTGFVWDEYGHVVTNHHVIEVEGPDGKPITEAEELQVKLPDGKAYKARVIGGSIQHDIAVLQVFAPLKDLKPIALGSSRDLMVGQSVLAIGNPWGLDHTMTEGIISGLGREVSTDETLGRRIRGAIQTDAAINPGNSGGPLLDSAGRLIGMNTAIKSTSGASAGVGFAIPVDTLNRIVPQLIAKGQMEPPVLGFYTVPDSESRFLGVTKGAVIHRVEPGGRADKAGFQGLKQGAEGTSAGDVIIGFQGQSVESAVQLFDLLELVPRNAALEFEVLREGKAITITIRPPGAEPQKGTEGPLL